MSEPNVKITAKRYIELLKAFNELHRLRAAGVDNWEGYPGIEEEEDDD